MNENSSFEQRVSRLENLMAEVVKSDTDYVASFARIKSQIYALQSICAEICGRYGVSEAEFERHFQLRERHYYDRILTGVENVNPAAAAKIDERSFDDLPSTDRFPNLFP